MEANQTAMKANDIATNTQRAILSIQQPPTSDFHGVSQSSYSVAAVISNVGGSAARDVVVSEDQVQDVKAITQNGSCPLPTAQVTGKPIDLPAGRDTAYHFSVTVPASFMNGRLVDPALNLVLFITWTDFDGAVDEGCYNPVTQQGGGQVDINGLPYSIFRLYTNPFSQHVIPFNSSFSPRNTVG